MRRKGIKTYIWFEGCCKTCYRHIQTYPYLVRPRVAALRLHGGNVAGALVRGLQDRLSEPSPRAAHKGGYGDFKTVTGSPRSVASTNTASTVQTF